MATAPKKPVAQPAPEVKTGELVQSGNQSLGEPIPDFIPVGSAEGTEGIGRDDLQMPRLAIAQAMSPQKLEGNSAYIEGLKLGDMFNTLSGEIYGKGPLEFIIVRRDNPRWVEFDEERNMVDPNVPLGDSRTEWTTNDKGERVPPIATQFYDYVIVLADSGETLALSMSKTNIKAAKKLNGLIKMRMPPVPLYARRFTIETANETNEHGTFGVFVVKSAGTPGVPNSDLVKDREQFEILKAIHTSFKDTVLNIDRRDDGPAPVGSSQTDAAAASTSAPGM